MYFLIEKLIDEDNIFVKIAAYTGMILPTAIGAVMGIVYNDFSYTIAFVLSYFLLLDTVVGRFVEKMFSIFG